MNIHTHVWTNLQKTGASCEMRKKNAMKNKEKSIGYRIITAETRIKIEPIVEMIEKRLSVTERAVEFSEGTPYVAIGESDSPLSGKAKKMLEKALEGKGEATVGYAICTDGESYAICSSDPRCTEAAVEYFTETFPTAEAVKTFPLLPYLKERGERIKERAWDALKEHLGEYGEEVVTELKRLYSLFDPSNVLWSANLLDPDSGLWYFSNSARDTFGYLPSIEETYNAICFPDVMGMYEMINGGTRATLPKRVQDKMASSLISMQDEDTFFYNPQWPKEYIIENNLQSRITRDKASALWILRSLGREPKYADKAVVEKAKKGDGKPRVMAQFESVEAFRAHLCELETQYLAAETPERRAYLFYYFGNLFQSVIPYVNANPEYKRMLIEFFEKYQNPETGVWSEVVCFDAVNALHKIGAVFNSLATPLKHVDKMVDMVMKVLAITPEEYQAYSYIDVYNIWSCFPYLYKNITEFGEGEEGERRAKKAEIKELIFGRAAEAIKNSYNQVKSLRRTDSAFSNRSGATPFTMGCPVAVPDVKEGNTASVYSLTHHIFMALEALDYEVPYCTEYERTVYVNALEEIERRGPQPKKKADYRIICKNPESEAVKEYARALSEVVDVVGIYPDTEPRIVREIVIGRCARDTAEEAYRKLESRLGEGESGYVIYFTGRMVIAYTDPKYIPNAIEHIVSHYPAVATVKTFQNE